MKFLSTLLFLPALISADHLPKCSDSGVTDLASCLEWCGGEGMGHFDIVQQHADSVDGLHVEKLRGMECHCDGEEHNHRLLAEGEEEHDHGDEAKACWIGYKLPSCISQGVEDCHAGEEHHDEEGHTELDSNTTDVTAMERSGEMTCAELCETMGMHEMLNSEMSACHHVDHFEGDGHDHEGDDHGHEHRARVLAEETEEGHTEDHFTMCFCGTDEPGEEGILVCADEGWEGEGHGEETEAMGASTANSIQFSLFGLLAVAAAFVVV